jgi:hypothetical protein
MFDPRLVEFYQGGKLQDFSEKQQIRTDLLLL